MINLHVEFKHDLGATQPRQGSDDQFYNLLHGGDGDSDEYGAGRMHTGWRHHWPVQLLTPRLLHRAKEIVDGSHTFPS